MGNTVYGVANQTLIHNATERCAEELSVNGFSIIRDVLSDAELNVWRRKIDDVYARQESSFTRESLVEIEDLDVARAPLIYDFDFCAMAFHPRVLAVARKMLGDWIILNLENAIISRPDTKHHQASWHRDLPYQNFVSSKPLSISALFVIDDFSKETGGTLVLPFSHKQETMPSELYAEAHAMTVTAPAGSVLMFDSMLFHRAGLNQSKNIRRAVNHIYTIPIMKQQYDFPRALGEREDITSEQAQLLGYTSQVPMDDQEWRLRQKIKKREARK